MKRLAIIFMSLLLCLCLSGCEGNYNNKESYDFHAISSDAEDTADFIKEVTNYANTFGQGFVLGELQLIYSNTYQLEIDFTFMQKASGNALLFLYYDSNKKGIVRSEYMTGSSKALLPISPISKLDTKEWKISFNQGLEKAKKQMAAKHISSFKRIGCYCYANKWDYDVFFSDHYQDKVSITIPVS